VSHLTAEQVEAAAKAVEGEVRGHLASCLTCQASVRDAAARQALLGGLRPYTLSDIAFRRVEARLMEAVEQGVAAPRFPWRWAWPIALALLAVLVVVQLRGGTSGVAPVAQRPATRPGLAPPRVEPLTVLAASADARVQRGDTSWLPVSAAQVLEAGVRVEGRSVRLATAASVRWGFGLAGTLVVGDGASARLTGGELVAQVSGGESDLAVGPLHVLATEAIFSLSRSAAEVVVDVAEGTVELVDSSLERRQVRGPQRLRLRDGAPLSQAASEPSGGVRPVPVPARPWALFDAASLPRGTRLILDGVPLGEAPFAALVSSGRHRLALASPGEAVHESWVELSGRYVPRLALPEAAVTEPDAAAVQRLQEALRRQRPKLQACYEKWLKANPSASAEVELRLVVSASGRVKDARVEGGGPGAPVECLVRSAKALSLPALGSELELEVPLRLTTERDDAAP
jgi:hypothetical protein